MWLVTIRQNALVIWISTQIEVLADIKKWVCYDISDGAQQFLWLMGDPSSRKPAITISIT